MIGRLLIGIAFLSVAYPALAQETEEPLDLVVLQTGTLENNGGRIALNVAAGDNNQHASAALVAIGAVATGTVVVDQLISAPLPMSQQPALITVGSDAVVGNTGLISLNGSAGNGNQLANLAVLNLSQIGALSDLQLSQARAPAEPSGSIAPGDAGTEQNVAIANDAFSGNAGLVQINLTGGEANASANTFVLNVSAGGPQQP